MRRGEQKERMGSTKQEKRGTAVTQSRDHVNQEEIMFDNVSGMN